MFSSEALFMHNVDLIGKAVEEPSTENLFDTARLLRQLLFDENPLLHQVNRERRFKVMFEVNPISKYPPGLEPDQLWSLEGLSPRLGRPRPSPPLKLNLRDFSNTR